MFFNDLYFHLIANTQSKVARPVGTKDYPTQTSGPYYNLLNKVKIKQRYDLSIWYWKGSIQLCLNVLQDMTP